MKLQFKTINLVLLTSAITNVSLAADDITSYCGDFGGYINSATTVVDDSNELLGFTTSAGTFSTGVNDATLTSNGVTFDAQEFLAFPVPAGLNYT